MSAVPTFNTYPGSKAPESTIEATTSAVSWGAIFAGGLSAAALSLVLLSFGAGLGLAAISPWSAGSGATTFKVVTGVYLLVTAMMSSAVGGYIAGRLRTRWSGAHTREVFFRDTAHGMLSWALATVVTVGLMTTAVANIVGGASNAMVAGIGSRNGAAGPMQQYVDQMLRPAAGTTLSTADATAWREEVGDIFANTLRRGGEFSNVDRDYLARIVAARDGISPADARIRVDGVIEQVRTAADQMRKAAAQLSLWLAASLLLGAFSASLAAIEGGGLRDGTWHYPV